MRTFYIIFCLLWLSCAAEAQDTSQGKASLNLDERGVALEGYDPVSYFTDQGPRPGRKELHYTYQGAIYYFSSPKNRARFVSDPSAYEPQYGGWCAYAMGKKGEKVSINPKSFKITNNKLYVFFKNTFNDTLKDWNKEEEPLRAAADRQWKAISSP